MRQRAARAARRTEAGGRRMFLTDLLIVFAVAGAAVYLGQQVRVPSVVGLLAAGVLVGPHSLGLVADPAAVHLLAEVGVIVLLFAVGLEFSLSRVLAMGRLMAAVGVPQVALTVAATAALTYPYFGAVRPAVFAGMLVAMSSTAVVIKLLADRGELNASHGRLSVAVLLLQDLLVVAFVLAVPLLAPDAAPGGSPWAALLVGLATVAGILAAGRYVLPAALDRVVRTQNRELFLIAVVVACVGTAALTHAVGLSLALGAFLAGLTLSESEYGHQTLAEVLPFRDTLSSLFFVSVGMLLDLGFLRDHVGTVLLAVAALVPVKVLAVAVPAAAGRFPLRTGLLTAFALAQVGEFSFVLAAAGEAAGLLTRTQYQTFLAAAVLTMALTPLGVAGGPWAAGRLSRSRKVGRWLRLDPRDAGGPADGLRDHVVIAGYGFNGRNLAAALRDLGVPYLVLETNPEVVRVRRAAGEAIAYGDCTRPAVLRHAGVGRARVFAVAISDPVSARRAVHLARRINPGVRVVVRTRYQAEIAELRKLGADQVVPEEFETSVEVLARVLGELAVPGAVVRGLVAGIRADQYAAFGDRTFGRVPVRLPDDVRGEAETEACEVPAGSAAAGRTIGELRLRTRTGATVIAVRRGRQVTTNPGPDAALAAGDVAVLLGSPGQLAAAVAALSAPPPTEAPDAA